MTGEKNFIDFIIDTKEDEALLKDFINCKTEDDLEALFGNVYHVSGEDCIKLIRAKDELGLEEGTIPPAY
jgi:hypothetical protein